MKFLSKIALFVGIFLFSVFVFKTDALAIDAGWRFYYGDYAAYEKGEPVVAVNPNNTDDNICTITSNTTVDLQACNDDIGAPDTTCCTSSSGCAGTECGNISQWDWCHASGCTAIPILGACDFSFQYSYERCGATDTCDSVSGPNEGYLYPGLCTASGCNSSSTKYKICCNSNGTVSATCNGGLFSGTCPGGTITRFCSYPNCNASACADLAPTSTPTPTETPEPTETPTPATTPISAPTPTLPPGTTPTPTPTLIPASVIPAISAHCINSPNTGNEETIYWTNVPGFTADYVDISTNTSFSPYYNRGVTRQPNSFVSIFSPGFAPQNFTQMPNQSPPLSLSPNTTYYVRLYDSSTRRHSPPDGSASYPSFNQGACPTPTPTPAPGQIILSASSYCSIPSGNRPVIDLSWNNLTGNRGYLIQRCSGSSCGSQTPIQITRPQNVTDYTDGPFANNATYLYAVAACLSGNINNIPGGSCTSWSNSSNAVVKTTPLSCSTPTSTPVPGASPTPTSTPTPTTGPGTPTATPAAGAPNPPTVNAVCSGTSATLTISKPPGTDHYQITINGILTSSNYPAYADPVIYSYGPTIKGNTYSYSVTACNASNACSSPTPGTFTCPNTASPWIFVDGDVHSNTGINMPGGPPL